MSNDTKNEEAIQERQETVTFFNDKPSDNVQLSNPLLPTPSLDEATLREAKTHEIRNFLARPILIGSLPWSVSDISNATITTYGNPSVMFNKPNVRTKVAGFFGYKGTMVLTIQVNATRFMQGLLIISYCPMYSQLSATRAAITSSNLIMRTQLPHTTFDVSTDTEVSLAVPYVFVKPYLEIPNIGFNNLDDLGQFSISVYSPLVTVSGDTSVTVNVWAHLEDVDLEFPGVMISQSGRPVRRTKAGKTTTGGSSVSDRELTSVGLGPVSSMFSKISGVSNVLSSIPALSAVASPTSWLTAILSNAAAAAGWSNPSQSSPVAKMMPQRLAYSANVNGVDNSAKLAAFADNEVEVLPGFGGTDDDELSIKRMVQRGAYFTRINMDTSLASGSRFAQINIAPIALCQNSDVTITTPTSKTASFWINTPLSYVVNMFQMWRGSICLKFRIVKTEFHTGRILVAFSPGKQSYAPTTIDQTTSLYREVFDIADSNEFNICVPYVSTLPWTDYSGSIGYLNFFMLSTLRCPPTVSSTITLVVEVSGGDDMEFAIPRPYPNGIPCSAILTAQGPSPSLTQADFDAFMADHYPRPMISQGLGVNELSKDEPADMTMMPGGFGGCRMGNGDLSPHRFCVGEAILSLRHLLKRAVLFMHVSTNATPQEITPDPFSIFLPNFHPAGNSLNDFYTVDYYSAIGACFAMSRGGVRLKAWQPGDDSEITVRGVVVARESAYAGNAFTNSFPNGESVIPVKISMSGAVEVEIPQYSLSYARVNWYGTGADPATTGNSAIGAVYGTSMRARFQCRSNSKRTVILRQGADDTDFGCFIGVLPTIQNMSNFSSGINVYNG
jgi:hypothetical protein